MKFKLLDWLSKPFEEDVIDPATAMVIEHASFLELALQIAISYVANTISKCEIKTYKGGEEVREELYYLLNVNPNPNQNSSQFMNQLIERYYYHGDALVVPRKKSLYVADGFSPVENPLKDNVFQNVSIENQTIKKNFKASEVFYFKLDNKDVTSLVRQLYSDYGKVMAAAMSSYVSNNSDKWKVTLENVQGGDTEQAKKFRESLQQQLKEFLEADRAVYPQYRGTNLERIPGTGTSSADVIAMRKEIFETVAQAIKIPMSMMYGNITNMNEVVKVYLSICIDPLAQMISEELTRKTTDYDSWKAGDRVVVDTSKINHIDPFEIADKADKLISSGVYSIDKVLDKLGDDKLGTDFSAQHWMTKNYAPVEQVADALEGGEQNA